MIDPKQIAKMITEDPNEVNPLDNIRDEYDETDWCDGCLRDIDDSESMCGCQKCGWRWCATCEGRRGGFDYTALTDDEIAVARRNGEWGVSKFMSSCPNCTMQ